MMATSRSKTSQDTAFQLMEAPGHLLRRSHQRSYELFTQIVGSDVTRQQIALLIALSQKPGASQNELVGLTGFDKSTLKEMLGRMVAKKWVERERDPEDSRAWKMHVTPEGEALLDEKMDKVRLVQEEILAPLPEDLRSVFLRCLRILAGLEQA
ncbi:MAG: MarR family winged helix-turn-helix transcriptional regulator [Sphingobium sp.]|nr:winged helix-turn-helix transcriptional regulator [Sphingobium sp.]MCP5400116.1 winged helix-turn-helix transcriptional regulator [Sphingomonas sp.]